MKSIVICNQKGGIGKSTGTINLAGAFAHAGKRVVVADCDPQSSLTKSLIDTCPDKTLLDIFNGENIEPLKTYNPNIDLVPASKNLSAIIQQLSADFNSLFTLQEYIQSLTGYDIALLDTAPTLAHLTLAAMVSADYLIVPVSTQFFSLAGTNDLLDTYKKVKQRLNPGLEFAGAFISVHDKRTALACEVLEEIRNQFKDRMFKSIIPRTIRVEEAQTARRTLVDLFPDLPVTRQYIALAEEILTRIGA